MLLDTVQENGTIMRRRIVQLEEQGQMTSVCEKKHLLPMTNQEITCRCLFLLPFPSSSFLFIIKEWLEEVIHY